LSLILSLDVASAHEHNAPAATDFHSNRSTRCSQHTRAMSDPESPRQASAAPSNRSPKRRRLEGYDSATSTPAYTTDEEGEHSERKYSQRPASHDHQETLPYRSPQLRRGSRSASPDNVARSYREHSVGGYSDRSERSLRRTSSPRSLRSSIAPEAPTPLSHTPTLLKPRGVHYKLKCVLQGHDRGVSQVKFSPDGRWIASCSADATIKVWDAATGQLMQTLEGHLAGVSTVAWSPDSKTIASGSDDKAIRLWNRTTGEPYSTPLLGHHNYVYSLAFSPKGNMLVSGSYDEAVFLWDVRAGRQMRSLPAHSDPVGGVDFVRDGTLVVSCATDGLVRIWDTATGQCLRTIVHEDNAPVTSVRFSPNGKYVLAWTLDGSIRLWDYVEGLCKKTYQGHENKKYSIGGTFGVYGREAFVASGSEDGSIVLWDVKSKNILQTFAAHEGVVLWVDTHPTLPMIVSCGLDGAIKIWSDDGEHNGVNGSLEGEVAHTNGEDAKIHGGDRFENAPIHDQTLPDEVGQVHVQDVMEPEPAKAAVNMGPSDQISEAPLSVAVTPKREESEVPDEMVVDSEGNQSLEEDEYVGDNMPIQQDLIAQLEEAAPLGGAAADNEGAGPGSVDVPVIVKEEDEMDISHAHAINLDGVADVEPPLEDTSGQADAHDTAREAIVAAHKLSSGGDGRGSKPPKPYYKSGGGGILDDKPPGWETPRSPTVSPLSNFGGDA
jgi:COMPASS component SWD3